MAILTPARSAYLVREVANSTEARQVLADRFFNSRTHPYDDPNLVAWGQYLQTDGQDPAAEVFARQFGIFGSSAGVQVLAMHSASGYVEQLQHALAGLPLDPAYSVMAPIDQTHAPLSSSSADPDGLGLLPVARMHLHYHQKGDLLIVHKLASVLEAGTGVIKYASNCSPPPDLTGTTQSLLRMRLPGQGWPDFKTDAMSTAAVPHTTAVALYALSGCQHDAQIEQAAIEAINWFRNKGLERMSIATLSLMAMAIARLRAARELAIPEKPESPNPYNAAPRDVQDACARTVTEWIKTSDPRDILRTLEGTEYLEPPRESQTASDRFRFLFYMPHCLAALLVLTTGDLLESGRNRRFVLRTSQQVTSRIRTERRFIAAGRQMASTVEHMWLYRMLLAFETTRIYKSRRQIASDRISERKYGRPMAALCSLLTIAVIISPELTSGRLSETLLLLSAALVSVIAAAVVVAFKRLS